MALARQVNGNRASTAQGITRGPTRLVAHGQLANTDPNHPCIRPVGTRRCPYSLLVGAAAGRSRSSDVRSGPSTGRERRTYTEVPCRAASSRIVIASTRAADGGPQGGASRRTCVGRGRVVRVGCGGAAPRCGIRRAQASGCQRCIALRTNVHARDGIGAGRAGVHRRWRLDTPRAHGRRGAPMPPNGWPWTAGGACDGAASASVSRSRRPPREHD